MTAEVVGGLTASYLIVTLTATSLAKLHRWRGVALSLVRTTNIPTVLAPVAIMAVSATELVLASLLVLGVRPRVTGCAITLLFLLFGGHRIVVAMRTTVLVCSCAGTVRTARATPSAVAGAVMACLFQAGIGCLWLFLGSRAAGGALEPLEVAAWIAPFIAMLTGVWRRRTHRPVIDRLKSAQVSSRNT